MSDTIKIVELPEAGDGHTVIFRNRTIQELQRKFGKDSINDFPALMSSFDMEVIEFCAANAIYDKKKNHKPLKLEDFDDKIRMNALVEKFLDAFFISMSGMTFVEHMELQTKKVQEEAERLAKLNREGGEPDDPPRPQIPESSSVASVEQPSG